MAPRRPIALLDVRTRAEWRAWLDRHHGSATKIWLVFHKHHTGMPCIDYDAAVEEALCFGWIDSSASNDGGAAAQRSNISVTGTTSMRASSIASGTAAMISSSASISSGFCAA